MGVTMIYFIIMLITLYLQPRWGMCLCCNLKHSFGNYQNIIKKCNIDTFFCFVLLGWTALHQACYHGFTEVIMELLEAGADVNIRGRDRELPLHLAVSGSNYEV